MPDIQAAATRKLGPLPAWGWGVAVGGAVIAFRIVRGKPATGSSQPSPTATVVGGGGMIGTGPDATPTDSFSGANSLVEQLQSELGTQSGLIDALQGTVKTLTDYQALQTKLSGLLKSRADALYNLAHWQTALNTYKDALAKCKTTTCKKTQNANIATANKNIATYTKQAGDLNTQITGVQDQINKLGATS